MAEFKFSCPFCGQHLQCDEQLAGRQITCPACHHLMTIPPSPAQAAQGNYAPESGMTWATFVPTPKEVQPAPPTVPPKPPAKE